MFSGFGGRPPSGRCPVVCCRLPPLAATALSTQDGEAAAGELKRGRLAGRKAPIVSDHSRCQLSPLSPHGGPRGVPRCAHVEPGRAGAGADCPGFAPRGTAPDACRAGSGHARHKHGGNPGRSARGMASRSSVHFQSHEHFACEGTEATQASQAMGSGGEAAGAGDQTLEGPSAAPVGELRARPWRAAMTSPPGLSPPGQRHEQQLRLGIGPPRKNTKQTQQ